MDLIKGILLVSSLGAVTSYHSQGMFCVDSFVASWSGGVFDGMSDRLYQFDCTSMSFGPGNCSSFGPVNSYTADFDFACEEGAITGVSSYYSDSEKDRQFSFICCNPFGFKLGQCSTSDYINDWQENTYTYRAPNGTVIRGVQSLFNNTLKYCLYFVLLVFCTA